MRASLKNKQQQPDKIKAKQKSSMSKPQIYPHLCVCVCQRQSARHAAQLVEWPSSVYEVLDLIPNIAYIGYPSTRL